MNRRPLKSRQSAVMQSVAHWMARAGVSPNAISVASMVFAALGAVAMLSGGAVGFVIAALGCQFRLICNLLDGLVAVEGGRGRSDGAFWNEVPDRVSDLMLIGAAGVAAGQPVLGAAAGAGSILTAYIREFGRAEGLAPDFGGPMAKPQRMAVLTGALILAAAEALLAREPVVLHVALWLILGGTALTFLRRSARIVGALNRRP